uniref:Uncharacterized protein n=1 Tax=Aegilops tauschii subsp. strangulata TaxID=200361 RepID=A0A453F2W8_AEGTS
VQSEGRERAHAHPPPARGAALPPPRRVHDQSERDGAGHPVPVRLRRGRGPILRPRPVVLLRLRLRARVQRRVELRVRGLLLRRRGRLRHPAAAELLRVAVLRRAPLLQPLRVGGSAPAGQILRVRAQRRRRTVQHQQAREAAHAQLRIRQGRLLRRPRQLLPELQQHALGEALRRVRARLAGPRAGGSQEGALGRRDQAVPEQDLEAVAEGGAWRCCCRGRPAAEEPLGVRGAVVVASSPGRLAPGAAGRHRGRHRALQGVDPPWCVTAGFVPCLRELVG